MSFIDLFKGLNASEIIKKTTGKSVETVENECLNELNEINKKIKDLNLENDVLNNDFERLTNEKRGFEQEIIKKVNDLILFKAGQLNGINKQIEELNDENDLEELKQEKREYEEDIDYSVNDLILNKAFDMIAYEDIIIKDYLKEDVKNIVLIIDGRYILINKNTIESQDRNLFWACKKAFVSRLNNEDNIDGDALMSLKALGNGGGYISKEDMFKLIISKNNNIYFLERVKTIPAVVSLEMRNEGNEAAVSASHCQPDEDFVYDVIFSVFGRT